MMSWPSQLGNHGIGFWLQGLKEGIKPSVDNTLTLPVVSCCIIRALRLCGHKATIK